MDLRHGGWKDCQIDVSDSTTLSDEVDLGHDFNHVLVCIPTITAAQISVQVAKGSGATYYPVYDFLDIDADTDVLQATASATTSKAIIFKVGSTRYIKLLSSQAQGADRDFLVKGFNI